MKWKLWTIFGVGGLVGRLVIAGILYVTFPVQMTTYGGMGLNYLKTLSTPAGTLSTEANPAYKGSVASAPAPPPAYSAWHVRAVQLHWVLFLILGVVMAILGLLAVAVRTLANENCDGEGRNPGVDGAAASQ